MSSDFEPPEIVSLKCERDICTNRNTDGHILRKCSGCRRVYFCSQECQRAWWPKHKILCRILQNPEARRTLPSYNTVNAARAKTHKYWHGKGPAAERIHWFNISGPENGEGCVKRAKDFVKGLDMEQVIQYAVQKFLETRSRGAVVFDFARPVPIFAGRGQFSWMPELVASTTGDARITEMVSKYDPATSATIFLYSIDSQERFMHLAGFQPRFGPLPPEFLHRVETMKREISPGVQC